MPKYKLSLQKLRKRLAAFGVTENKARGKGSHTLFEKVTDEGYRSFPVPTTRKDVLDCYVKAIRRKFKLMPEDGMSDEEFFLGR